MGRSVVACRELGRTATVGDVSDAGRPLPHQSDRGDANAPAESGPFGTASDPVPSYDNLPTGTPEPPPLDLDSIEQDLDAVEQALDRLAYGTYGIDDVTGEPIPDETLETDPTARRA